MASLGSLVDTPLGPLPVWSLAAIGVTAALLVAIAYRFRRRVPRPQYTVLKNGKRVRYANWLETQVLFTEIFEDDSYEKSAWRVGRGRAGRPTGVARRRRVGWRRGPVRKMRTARRASAALAVDPRLARAIGRGDRWPNPVGSQLVGVAQTES